MRSMRQARARISTQAVIASFGLCAMVAYGAYGVGCGGDDTRGSESGADGGGRDGTVDGAVLDGGNKADVSVFGDGSDRADVACGTCPSNYTCGPYLDNCGNIVACGKPCVSGKTCDPDTHSCTTTATACADVNAQCGIIQDACGVVVTCGQCTGGKVCDGTTHQCVSPAPPSDAGACVPSTLSCTGGAGQKLCGTIGDGCGGTKSCTCVAPDTCGGGGIPGECGQPIQCKDPTACGSFPNACGSGSADCGDCKGGLVCTSNKCAACVPKPNPCAARTCGSVDDGCGKMVACGANNACGAGEVCTSGNCCTPLTCAELPPDAGAGCAPIDDKCGRQLTCSPCTAIGAVCHSGACCQPRTCADVANGDAGAGDGGIGDGGNGGGGDAAALTCDPIDDGCGGMLHCNPCGNSDRCVMGSCKQCPVCDAGGSCDYTGNCAYCTPKTCADFPNAGCHPQDLGCGENAVCTPCTGTQVCLGNGTCCSPEGCNGRTGIVDDGCGGTLNCQAPR